MQIKASIEGCFHDWEVKWSHTYRDQNTVADWITEFGISVSIGFHVLSMPPEGCLHLLQQDLKSADFPM